MSVEPQAATPPQTDPWPDLVEAFDATYAAYMVADNDDPSGNAALDAWLAARDAAMLAAAPDIAAVLWKMRAFYDRQLVLEREAVAPIIADLERLGGAVSPCDKLLQRWLTEWRLLRCNIYQTADGISVSQLLRLDDADWADMANDARYEPHLRLYGREELQGARKAMQRLLIDNPLAIEFIAAMSGVRHG